MVKTKFMHLNTFLRYQDLTISPTFSIAEIQNGKKNQVKRAITKFGYNIHFQYHNSPMAHIIGESSLKATTLTMMMVYLKCVHLS